MFRLLWPRLRLVPTAVPGLVWTARYVGTTATKPQIEKLLIANRGEIACRIIATARRLGIPTVAVFSSADRSARHVSLADEACYIGQAPASESYLLGDVLLKMAHRHGATAIHPGYGFLSEDARFAELCEKEGVTFVGPSGSVIRTMGDKSAAKQIMRQAGVPVVPGYDGPNQQLSHLLEQGQHTVGFPLLVKATVGGGGKGMKLVTTSRDLEDAILSAQREAQASFGDSRVLLERFIQRPRHVEVQVMGDHYGNVLHFFERDCSVQRRHQKILEESPAPQITQAFRENICQSAVEAAEAVGYTNAGTVEFILDTESNDYYFMEMNTRLQVEHPVTEGVCRLDLVELQLMVASGRELPLKQGDIQQQGHSIEARLYAELPHQNFLPGLFPRDGHLGGFVSGAGRVERWQLPGNSAEFQIPGDERGTRVDSGVMEGDEIGVYYDPMIAKIISSGPTRAHALQELSTALNQTQVCGLPTNLEFLKRVVDHQSFKNAELSTAFIAQHEQELFAQPELPTEVAALSAALRFRSLQQRSGRMAAVSLPPPWNALPYARLNYNCRQEITLSTAEGQCYVIQLKFVDEDCILATTQNQTIELRDLSLKDHNFSAQVDGQIYRGDFCLFKRSHDVGIALWSPKGNCTLYTPLPDFSPESTSGNQSGKITAPMHGKVVKISVADGDSVEEGDLLLVLEAMKMEHMIKAPFNGTVQSVSTHSGSRVHDGQILMTLEPL